MSSIIIKDHRIPSAHRYAGLFVIFPLSGAPCLNNGEAFLQIGFWRSADALVRNFDFIDVMTCIQ
jgi:hypothetical protein